MPGIPQNVPSLDALLGTWELIEYGAEVFVILGCIGEFIADFTTVKTEAWRHHLGQLSLIVLTLALSMELIALVRSNSLSGEEIATLNSIAAEARATSKGFEKDIADANRAAAQSKAKAEGFRLEIAKARESAARAGERAASAMAEAAKLKLELERLKTPRTLTDQHISEITESLKRFAGQEFELGTIMGGDEPTAFAEVILKVLIRADWKSVQTGGFRNVFGTNGVTIVIHPDADSRTRNAASALAKALGSDAIRTATATDPSTPANRVRVEISDEPIKTGR